MAAEFFTVLNHLCVNVLFVYVHNYLQLQFSLYNTRNYLCLVILYLISFLDKIMKDILLNQPLSRRPPFPVPDRGEA
jgi:hypothetical protein